MIKLWNQTMPHRCVEDAFEPYLTPFLSFVMVRMGSSAFVFSIVRVRFLISKVRL